MSKGGRGGSSGQSSHHALVEARVLVVLSRVKEGHGLVFQEQQKIVSPPGTFLFSGEEHGDGRPAVAG